MGALWNFIAGKSTDWDKVEAEQAIQASIDKERRKEERKVEAERKTNQNKPKIMAYCRRCGKYSIYQDITYSRSAISDLMTNDSGCGSNKHEPELFEVPDGQQVSSTIKYFAYCRVCGKDSGRCPGPKIALTSLMNNSSGCGTGKHTPRLRIV